MLNTILSPSWRTNDLTLDPPTSKEFETGYRGMRNRVGRYLSSIEKG